VRDEHDGSESSGPMKRTGNLFRMKGTLNNCEIISRSVFIHNYPRFLVDVSTDFDESMALSMRPNNNAVVDICFKDLSLAVHVADKSINVVDNVTGRVRAKTMTALMGGSGAGKTSLLNALCGRAFYGEVHGEIHINGQRKDIEEIKDTVGFVPQDDIVYAELTVRENFIYAGRFRLPSGTPMAEIEELADGLELMAKPLCLFLDEPTSGLVRVSVLACLVSNWVCGSLFYIPHPCDPILMTTTGL
jgi:ABC-type multidrug transport system fused ATPase/permease subunit